MAGPVMQWVVAIMAPRTRTQFWVRFTVLVLGINLVSAGLGQTFAAPGEFSYHLSLIVATSLGAPLVALALAAMLHLAQLQDKLAMLAATDMLTGLPNRRAFLSRLSSDDAATHAATDGFLLVLDVDHFKRVNDTHGHAVGDICLQAMARRLREVTRADDPVGRLGGEEFAVFLPGAARDHAAAIGERLVQVLQVEARGQGVQLSITASVGATSVLRGLPLERPFHEADTALYAAKSAGRARMMFFEGTGADPPPA